MFSYFKILYTDEGGATLGFDHPFFFLRNKYILYLLHFKRNPLYFVAYKF